MAETNGLKRTILNIVDTSTGGNIVKVKDIYNDTASGNIYNDTVNGAIVSEDVTVKKINDGKYFVASIDMTASQSTDELNIFLNSGGSTEADRHLLVEVSANKPGVILIQENILDSGGAGTTAYFVNANRLSTDTTPHSIRLMGTTFSTDTADNIYNSYLSSNDQIEINKFILASSKEYLLRFEPAIDATRFLADVSFYID